MKIIELDRKGLDFKLRLQLNGATVEANQVLQGKANGSISIENKPLEREDAPEAKPAAADYESPYTWLSRQGRFALRVLEVTPEGTATCQVYSMALGNGYDFVKR